jgi:hypothetical protein
VANEQNLKPKPFTSENQPPNRGRKKGVPNRATVLKRWASVKLELTNPVTKEKQKGTVEDEVVLALISKARKGDVPAIREFLDSLYGKAAQPLTGEGGEGPVQHRVLFEAIESGSSTDENPDE